MHFASRLRSELFSWRNKHLMVEHRAVSDGSPSWRFSGRKAPEGYFLLVLCLCIGFRSSINRDVIVVHGFLIENEAFVGRTIRHGETAPSVACVRAVPARGVSLFPARRAVCVIYRHIIFQRRWLRSFFAFYYFELVFEKLSSLSRLFDTWPATSSKLKRKTAKRVLMDRLGLVATK